MEGRPQRQLLRHVVVVVIVVYFFGSLSTTLAFNNKAGCHEALLLSDTNQDRLLNRYPEYLLYLNHLSSSQSNNPHALRYSGFEALPRPLRDNYRAFTNTAGGSINITEFMYKQSTSSQVYHFCQQTKLSLASIKEDDTKMYHLRGNLNLQQQWFHGSIEDATISGSPQLESSSTKNEEGIMEVEGMSKLLLKLEEFEDDDKEEFAAAKPLLHPTTERQLASKVGCSVFIMFSDLDDSQSLNEQEFLVLANLLADRTLAQRFDDLPLALKTAFGNLASSRNEIWFDNPTKEAPQFNRYLRNVFQQRSNQGKEPQVVSSSTICREVWGAAALVLSSSGALVSSVTGAGTKLAQCIQLYAPTFDANQDGNLSADEFANYAQAVAASSQQPSTSVTFLDLSKSVQNIFFAQVAREQSPLAAAFLLEENHGDDRPPPTNHKLEISFRGACSKTAQIVQDMSRTTVPSHPASPQAADTQLRQSQLDSLRQQATNCTENPQDYNVNIDVQITFLDNEFAACDSQAQEDAINTNIQEALNQNFATTVTDWQGNATFGTFVFDPNQEINNVEAFGRFRKLADFPVQERNLQTGTCPSLRSEAAVQCTAPDYCRWGCIIASTTNCGNPPSTTNGWTALEEDVRARLASLGFDCLGIPDQLQVTLVIDAPNTTQAPPSNATTSAPTSGNITTTPQANTTAANQTNATAAPLANTTAAFQQGNVTVPPQSNITTPQQANTTSPLLSNITNTTSPPQGNTTSPPQSNTTSPLSSNTTFPPQGNATSPPQSNITNTTTPIPTTAPSNTTNGTLAPTISNTTNATTQIPTSAPSSATNGTLAPTTSNTSAPVNTTAPTPAPTMPGPVNTTPPVNTIAPTTPVPTNTPAPVNTAAPTTPAPTNTPTPVNTTAPTPAPPTPAPGPITTVKAYNSWIMANSLGQNAADLMADTSSFDGIRRAYAAFTDDIVAELAAIRGARLMLRRRRLAVSKQAGSSSVDRLEDSNCPDSVPASDTCVTAFGSVNLQITDEKTTAVSAEYLDTSQQAIDDGQLQQNLNEEDPGSIWSVEGKNSPVNPDEGLPEPPTDPPAEDRGGSDLKFGLIVSGSVAAFLVIIICLLVIVPACRKKRQLDKAKKESLEALREAERKQRAALDKKEANDGKDKGRGGPPWPKKNHDEGDNPYRKEVEELIQRNCPELMDELDSLLHQYQGREEELIAMLEDFKQNESVLLRSSYVDVESVSSSFESESLSVATIEEDVPVTEIKVEEAEEEVVENVEKVDDDDKSDSAEVFVEEVLEEEIDEDEDEFESEEEIDEDDEIEDFESEETEEEAARELPIDSDSMSSSTTAIYVVPRSEHGLEPPDDVSILKPQTSNAKMGLEPPDDESYESTEAATTEPQDEPPEPPKAEPPEFVHVEEVESAPDPEIEEDPKPETEDDEGINQSRSVPPPDPQIEEDLKLEPEDELALAKEMELLEKERLEAEGLELADEMEQLDLERLEAERLELADEMGRLEKERLEAERLEQEWLEAERLEQERLEAEMLEQERLEAERQRQREMEEQERARKAEEARRTAEEAARQKAEEERLRREEEEILKADNDDTEHSTYLSSDSSDDGYRIKWIQKNGYWHAEKIWSEEDFSESTGFYSTDSSDNGYNGYEEYKEAKQAWQWVKNGKAWAKETIDGAHQGKGGGSLLDEEECYFSSDSESDEDDAPAHKWVQKNGRWHDAASLEYSDG